MQLTLCYRLGASKQVRVCEMSVDSLYKHSVQKLYQMRSATIRSACFCFFFRKKSQKKKKTKTKKLNTDSRANEILLFDLSGVEERQALQVRRRA